MGGVGGSGGRRNFVLIKIVVLIVESKVKRSKDSKGRMKKWSKEKLE